MAHPLNAGNLVLSLNLNNNPQPNYFQPNSDQQLYAASAVHDVFDEYTDWSAQFNPMAAHLIPLLNDDTISLDRRVIVLSNALDIVEQGSS